MSYNGIGLSTPRGSGTSGHIQANRSHLRARQQFDKPADFKESFSHRAPDQAILDHERRRRVEAKCFELQVSLEDDGVEAEEVERQVGELRERLLAQSAGAKGTDREGAIKPSERHELAQAKELANEKLRTALGIKADHVEGLAFDKTAQAEIKRQKAEERERAREERAKIEAQLKVDREKAMQVREAQRKKHEEDLARQRRKHEDELARDHREHEARMREDRRRMDDELAARRQGAPPTAGARGGESTSLPYGDVPSTRRSSRSRSPEAGPPRRRRDSRSPSHSRSRSRSPAPRRRYSDSRSPSPPRRDRSFSPPPRRRGRSPTRSPSRSRSPRRSRSYASRSRSRSRSPSGSRSPPRRRARRDSPSPARRSASPPRRRRSDASDRGGWVRRADD
ncbi:hypothetical protein JCM21900_003416 [Sporobolomyces salmonicolor]